GREGRPARQALQGPNSGTSFSPSRCQHFGEFNRVHNKVRPSDSPGAMSDVFLDQAFGGSKRFDIPPGETTIGRRADANIVLPFPGISRLHARFERDGRVVWLTDLNSTNGTSVNDRYIKSNERVMLYPGDQIFFSHGLIGGPGSPALLNPGGTSFVIKGNRAMDSAPEDDDPDGAPTTDAALG